MPLIVNGAVVRNDAFLFGARGGSSGADGLLLESGDDLLLETGDQILLE